MINRRSKKRAKQEREYAKIRPENKACFFCGRMIYGTPDRHHLDGREGEELTNSKLLFNVHRECHSLYHDGDYKNATWYPAFMRRLRRVSEEIYWRHKLREDK